MLTPSQVARGVIKNHMINKDNLSKIPNKPGTYLFKNSNKEVIYVGKALNLRNRVKSYFIGKSKENRTDNLLENIEKIDYQIVNTEMEALLLEARLIKQYHPKFNKLLKDDTRYLYVGITKEEYPRIKLIRQPEHEENLLDWYGPFPSSYSLKEILRFLRRIFPYCTDPRCSPKKPCFYYRIKMCPGVGIVPSSEYKKNITKIRMFLKGEVRSLLKKLEKQMILESANLKFEQAGETKKKIQMINNLLGKYQRTDEESKFGKQLAGLKEILIKYQGFDPFIIKRIEGYDVSNLGKGIVVGSMVAFINGEPDNSLYRQFRIDKFGGDTEGIYEILKRRLKHQEWIYPQLILVDGGKGQVSAAVKAVKDLGMLGKVGVLGLAKEYETIIIPRFGQDSIKGWKEISLTANSLPLQLLQHIRDEAHRFAQRYYKKIYKKNLLK